MKRFQYFFGVLTRLRQGKSYKTFLRIKSFITLYCGKHVAHEVRVEQA